MRCHCRLISLDAMHLMLILRDLQAGNDFAVRIVNIINN